MADGHVLLEHGHGDQCADACDLDAGDRQWITLLVRAALTHVGNLNRLFILSAAGQWRIRRRAEQGSGQLFPVGGRQWTVQRDGAESIAFAEPERAVTGPAQLCRIRQHRFEHGLKLARRTGNDAQHFGGGGLLLQRLGKLARALLLGLEQAYIFDRDHRLVGEGADQFDLLVGKRLDPLARQNDDARRRPLAQQRNAEHGAGAADLRAFFELVFSIRQYIGNLHRSAFKHGATDNRAFAKRNRMLRHELVELPRIAVVRDLPVRFAELAIDRGHVGFAQPRRRFDQRVEHRLQIEGRAADHFEHVGGGDEANGSNRRSPR